MDSISARRAKLLLQRGLDEAERGELNQALLTFRTAAELYPTADAFTYWGWMEHQIGHTSEAIHLCQKAIALDPEFGNPYNDIGAYLISLRKWDAAIPWLERATRAKRYEPRQFPHINLGRVYLAKEMPFRALAEFKKALALMPGDPELQRIIEAIRLSLKAN